jgi:chromosome partitioning protein
MHQRKAYAARMQEGRTAGEIEPQGKAAAEVRELLLWVCDKVIDIPMKQVTELPKQRA